MRLVGLGGGLLWWGSLRCTKGTVGRLLGLALCVALWYTVGMSSGSIVLRAAKKSTAITNAGTRFEVAELKKLIHKSGICLIAIEMAKTGKRPVWDRELREVVMEDMSEAAHIDMLKFIVRKVLPDIKEIETVDDKKALDAWAAVIEAEEVKGLEKV